MWEWYCFRGPRAFSDFMPTVWLSAAMNSPERCILPPAEIEGKLLSHQHNVVEALKPDCLHSIAIEDYLFPSLQGFSYLML